MPGGGASSGRLHRCAFSRSCHPAAYGSPTSGGYEAAPPTPRMGDLMGTRIGHAGFLALAVLLGASERGFAAACNGRGVPEALAAAQAQCCPARNHGAYVSCAAHLTNELVKQGKLQPSCKSLIFKAGCPAATTTTLQTTTTTAAPRTTTTSSAPATTTTSTSAPPGPPPRARPPRPARRARRRPPARPRRRARPRWPAPRPPPPPPRPRRRPPPPPPPRPPPPRAPP